MILNRTSILITRSINTNNNNNNNNNNINNNKEAHLPFPLCDKSGQQKEKPNERSNINTLNIDTSYYSIL